MHPRPASRLAALVGLSLIVIGYFVAGATVVPFHGDESIWIYMSHDFEDLFVRRDTARLLYEETPADPEDQSLRELNNPLAKYVISLSWRAVGYRDGDLNGYWVWGAGWDWNAENGRIPPDGLLHASRRLPAALGAIGALAVMAIGTWLWNWRVGGLAALLLAADASYLLHTRRAMAEGTLMACGSLAVALTIAYLTRQPNEARRRVWWVVGIGVLTGLAVATKLNGAIVAMVVAIALTPRPPLSLGEGEKGTFIRSPLTKGLADVGIVAGVALVVVMALSPFLWVNPAARIRDTLRDMNTLVEDQKRGRDWLDTPGKRAAALIEQTFWAQTAYYEDEIWSEWVGDQIERYEASPLSGWRRPPWARVALGVAFVVGLIWLAAGRPDDETQKVARRVVLTWLAVAALVNLVIIPFAWQRYYLTLWSGVALVESVGIAALIDRARSAWKGSRNLPESTA